MRRLRERVPLRVTLVAALIVLVTVALAASGLAATATLRSYLVDRVDSQLQGAAHAIADRGTLAPLDPLRPGEPGDRGGGDADGAPGERDGDRGPLPSAFVVQVSDADGDAVYGPTSNLLDSSEPLPDLPTLTRGGEQEAPRAFTVDAVSGDAQWRVRAVPVVLTDGSAGTLLVAQSLGDVGNTLDRLLLLLLVIGAVTVVVLAGVGYLLVRASLRPLREVEETAAAIASGDLTRRVPEAHPNTEVGQLAGALNGMLGQIEAAFAERQASEGQARRSEERMRRFVADASHELRTPLTSIRGYAELYRQGAATDPEEVRRLLRRIEEEAARMGLLVEDLLLLARLDQQRPLAQEPVDLLALVTDAVANTRAMQPERPVRLEIGALEPPPVVIGDEARLRQVLANLTSNALHHTPSGTPVTVSLTVRPDVDARAATIAVDVKDEGPGLEPQHAARVFERFYRADSSRNRADGGTGLGLAIAHSLVAAHGGSLTLDTAPGNGARFRVELPTPLAADSP